MQYTTKLQTAGQRTRAGDMKHGPGIQYRHKILRGAGVLFNETRTERYHDKYGAPWKKWSTQGELNAPKQEATLEDIEKHSEHYSRFWTTAVRGR